LYVQTSTQLLDGHFPANDPAAVAAAAVAARSKAVLGKMVVGAGEEAWHCLESFALQEGAEVLEL
jgi:hypothetical protein